MNSVIFIIVKWAIQKALLEAGKQSDWPTIKADIDAKIDALVPTMIYNRVEKYLANSLIDLVASYFQNAPLPQTPEELHQVIDRLSQTMLGRVAAELLKV